MEGDRYSDGNGFEPEFALTTNLLATDLPSCVGHATTRAENVITATAAATTKGTDRSTEPRSNTGKNGVRFRRKKRVCDN